jgi:hypothetical protein
MTKTVFELALILKRIDLNLGYVSWRNEETGSWFGNALSSALMKHSCDKELHHILTIVSHIIFLIVFQLIY